jgi:hypothetical protein
VEANYLTALCNDLYKRGKCSACSIYFEHPLSGDEFSEDYYKAIALYELHLRYYNQGLVYAGFPFAYHTIGSAMAVKTEKYVKAGGMNRRQAGEDFYFIQKLLPPGGYFNLNSTTVYPSPRTSSRVLFGTGASIIKLSTDKSSTLLTYNILAFKELCLFFGLIDNLFKCRSDEIHNCFRLIPKGLGMFLSEHEFVKKIEEIKDNTSGINSFKKRFFSWFNMFKIVKYLNHVHTGYFEKKPVEISASELLQARGIVIDSKETKDLLLYYRAMEKNENK